jgi:hypothetical protein
VPLIKPEDFEPATNKKGRPKVIQAVHVEPDHSWLTAKPPDFEMKPEEKKEEIQQKKPRKQPPKTLKVDWFYIFLVVMLVLNFFCTLIDIILRL